MNLKKRAISSSDLTIEQEFKNFIVAEKHPCIMANTVFMMDAFHLKVYDSIHCMDSLKRLMGDLETYIAQYDFNSNDFQSFIAVFPNDSNPTEEAFEKMLWNCLQQLHNLDTYRWDKTVSKNPKDDNFSFSLLGKAFYIVGMHPKSSRMARQSPYTTLVFNLHWQFERLREMGMYQNVKKRIRKRDKKLQGTINPVLKDFGNESEVKQYSGRHVEDNWRCPFHPKPESI